MTTHQQLANAVRFLAIDAVQKANSGHPGMPMGMADIAATLWQDFLKHNPTDPKWLNRDRFILSNGHGAMLHYALLHLSGYDLSIEDLKQFRQLHSKTPGHPENFETPGVETTTGPLGQGLANGVGMAIAEKILAAEFNRPGFPIIDHYTYVFAGDGCLMEGISHEVCSLAGTLGLGKLIVFWDDNGISIDGDVSGWFTVHVPKQFEAYEWQVITNVDGHDPKAISAAILQAQNEKDKPTLICCRTKIGFGSPNKVGTSDVHGAPLGHEEIAATRTALNWPHAPFEIPADIYATWNAQDKGIALEKDWQAMYTQYRITHPQLAMELERRVQKQLPAQWSSSIEAWLMQAQAEEKPVATRKSSQQIIAKIAAILPELIGGSADLSCSNLTDWPQMKALSKDQSAANYIYYGVREFGMAAIMNGLALYNGFIPFGGTFLVFQTYCANAVRMSALMKQQVIYVFTHDSIGLGEDGPTHQPIAEAATLRMTPNMTVWRPCDPAETVAAWQAAIEQKNGPTSLLLSRQNLNPQKRDAMQVANIQRGAYILLDAEKTPDIILIATGSEVMLAMETAVMLQKDDIAVRVVSMPSCEVFMAQDYDYRESVLPSSVRKRIAIEASASDYWYKFVGLDGTVIGMQRFGASAPAKEVFADCGFTVQHVYTAANLLLQKEKNTDLTILS